MGIKLIKPTLEYGNDIMEYRKAFLESGESMDGCGDLRNCSTALEWIEDNKQYENEETTPSDKVSSEIYIGVRISDNKVVGVINFRHHINHPILSVWGGHIGYSVHPSERKKGYAKEMLRQVIIRCKEYGLDRVLVTCNRDNLGSKMTILSNGGVFESTVNVGEDIVARYWIEL